MNADASRHARKTSIALGAAALFIAALAAADEAADRKAAAQRLFVEGQAALDKGDNPTACTLMRNSLALFAVANSLFNVAQCDERDGKIALALEHWKRGMSLIDATDKRMPVVKKAIEDLEVRVPRMSIVVDSKYEPIDVLIDNEVVPKDKLSAAMLVDPGKHAVTFRKSGHEDRQVEILLNERERTEVVAEPGAEVVAPPVPKASAAPSVTMSVAPPPPPPPGMPPLKVGGFVALGIGGAALIGTAITGGKILANDGTINDICPNMICANGRPNDIIKEQKTLLPVNAALWGIGIAGAAAGTVMLVISSRKGAEGRTPIATPLLLPQGGGIGLSGRF